MGALQVAREVRPTELPAVGGIGQVDLQPVAAEDSGKRRAEQARQIWISKFLGPVILVLAVPMIITPTNLQAEITWVQALGLLVLARLLVGGRGHGGPGGRRRWRGHWERKFANMSPEERERWKAERGRYCDGGTDGSAEHQAAL